MARAALAVLALLAVAGLARAETFFLEKFDDGGSWY